MASQPAITFTSGTHHISSVSTSTADPYYHVFINHHVPEVNKTLASQLYYRLHVHGLGVFKYKEGNYIKLTCEREAAIRNASLHIAIFSTKYAESVCCLNELLLILETGSIIIPSFLRCRAFRP